MKKTFLAALTGVVVLAGCAKTEVTEVSDNRAISFSNFVTNSVKSIDNTDALNKFYVYGGFADNYNLFEDVEVTKADGAWTYNPTRYWTVNTYNFAAYSNSNSKAGVTATWNAVSNKHLSLDFNIQDAETDDLLYAAQSASWNGVDAAPTVDFTFKHILSKVAFQFSKAADLNGVNLDIIDIKVLAKTSGTFVGEDITEGQYPFTTWETSGDASEVAYDDDVTLNANDAVVTVSRVMIPQDITGYNVTFSVLFNEPDASGSVNSDGTPKTLNFEVDIDKTDGNNWKPGYSYVYKAVIDAENLDLKPIVFTVDVVSGWEPDSNVDLDIPTGTI